MKRLALGSLLIAGLIALLSAPLFAQSATMTEEHIERIRANCVEAQSTLTQLHKSDALLRVNRGQLYESIATKLMTPLNSRIALAKLDNSSFTLLTVTYDQQLAQFRTSYKEYEEATAKTLRINCINQPVAFYDSVADARAKRQLVFSSNAALQKTIEEYGVVFAAFKQKFLQENGQ